MIVWLSVLVFFVVTIAIVHGYLTVDATYRKHQLLQRLLTGNSVGWKQSLEGAFCDFLIMVGKTILPRSESERQVIRKQLDRAGFQRTRTLEIYYGVRVISALLFCVLVLGLLWSWRGISGQTLILSYAGLMLGYYAPMMGLRWKEKQRSQCIFRELPDALDILLVCMNAGLSFDRALLRVSRELLYIAPVLAREFERYFYEVESGLPRQEALANLADRNQMDALTSVVNVLVQSVRFGTDIAQALRIHANGLRTERRQIAEERAAKVSTKLVFPTVLFIMPALMLVILGPASIRLLERVRELNW